MAGCLEGIRVLELARFQAGPRCGMLFAELGAEVIKIEKIGGEENRSRAPVYKGQSLYFTVYNRGKKSITLDLYTDKGKGIFKELVKLADVVLENFRPGVMAKMGFGYEALRAINPRIVLTSVSGFGQFGPDKHRGAFDNLGQAMSGLMHLTGSAFGRPIGTGSSIMDRITSLNATIGTLAALRYRDATGEGQVVDVCLLDSGLTLTEVSLGYYLLTGQSLNYTGHPVGPFVSADGGKTPPLPERWPWARQAKDGWVSVGAATNALNARLFRAIGRPELADDPRYVGGGFGSGVEDPSLREKVIDEWLQQNSVEDIVRVLEEAEVPCFPILTVAQAAEHPHLKLREMMVEVEDKVSGRMFVPGRSIKFSKSPGPVGPVPVPGEHNDEVYGKLLHYSPDRIEALRKEGVI